MFICNDCNRPTPPGTPQRKAVTQTRERTDPITEHVRVETMKEISLCPICAQEHGIAVLDDDADTMHAFTYQRQAKAEGTA